MELVVVESANIERTTSVEPTQRRSGRNPQEAPLARSDVRRLLEKIESNHLDTVVFKIKAHVHSDINAAVFDAVIEAFHKNSVCQALYIQNISSAIYDSQVVNLIELLKQKQIWCLNIGENYSVTLSGWVNFCKSLPLTSVTHLYVSEHTIPLELKNKMRDHIRENRKKHDLHSAIRNIRVISRCTNMWWNPINSIRHQLDPNKALKKNKNKLTQASKLKKKESDPTPSAARNRTNSKTKTKSANSTKRALMPAPSIEVLKENPAHTAYWAEGTGGKGALVAWKFHCICGEMCSSYEDYRYHPTGAMYACTACGVWSHVVCMLGRMSLEELEELETVYCNKCRGKVRREKLRELRQMNEVWEDGNLRGAENENGENGNENGADENEVEVEIDENEEIEIEIDVEVGAEVGAYNGQGSDGNQSVNQTEESSALRGSNTEISEFSRGEEEEEEDMPCQKRRRRRK